jgi:preprotein translocase subunit SecF
VQAQIFDNPVKMQQTMEEAATLKDNVKDYVETKIDIIKLKAISKGAPLAANIIMGVALAFLGIFILMFLSFSAAYAISDATDRPFLGFLIVAGFYILLAVLVVVLKDKLLTAPIMRSLLDSLYTKKESGNGAATK